MSTKSVKKSQINKKKIVIVDNHNHNNDNIVIDKKKKSGKNKQIIIRKEYIGPDPDEYNKQLKEFDSYIKLKNAFVAFSSGNINFETEPYTKSIIYLHSVKYEFSETEIELLFTQLSYRKSSSVLASQYISHHHKKLHRELVNTFFNIISFNTDSGKVMLNKLYDIITQRHYKVFYDCAIKSDPNIFTIDQLSRLTKYSSYNNNALYIIPSELKINYGIFEQIILSIGSYRFENIHSKSRYCNPSAQCAQDNLDMAKSHYDIDKLIKYCHNVENHMNLSIIKFIDKITPEILNQSQKHKLTDICIDQWINFKSGSLDDITILGENCIDEETIVKICTHLDQKQFYNVLIRYIIKNNTADNSNIITDEFVTLLKLYVELYKNVPHNSYYNKYLTDQFAHEYPVHRKPEKTTHDEYYKRMIKMYYNDYFKLFDHYLANNNNIIKYTQVDLEYAYKKGSIPMINYLKQYGINFNIVCLEYACGTVYTNLAAEIINNKIFPNDTCITNAIHAQNFDTIQLLFNMGCRINDKMLEQIVKTKKIILNNDLSSIEVEYDSKLYILCCKHDIDTKSIYHKFTLDKKLLELHVMCKSNKWTKIHSYVIKHDLGFDQICVKNACGNSRNRDVITKMLKYSSVSDESESADESEDENDDKTNVIIEQNIKQKSDFVVTFSLLQTAYESLVDCTSIIQILKSMHENNGNSITDDNNDNNNNHNQSSV